MKEITIAYEYTVTTLVFAGAFVGFFAMIVFALFSLALTKDFPHSDKMPKIAMVFTATIAALGAVGFANGPVQDSRQNNRDREAMEAGFEQLLEDVAITQGDQIKLANIADEHTIERGTTEEIELTTGLVTVAYHKDGHKLGLSYEPRKDKD